MVLNARKNAVSLFSPSSLCMDVNCSRDEYHLSSGQAAPAVLGKSLETSELILDFDEARAGIDRQGELAHIPDWLLHDTRAWAAVPLLHFDRLVGLVVLARPLVARVRDGRGAPGSNRSTLGAAFAGRNGAIEIAVLLPPCPQHYRASSDASRRQRRHG